MKKWWKAAGARALRTVCQALIASIGTAAALSDVDWLQAVSAAALMGILSLLTSVVVGLPEVDGKEKNSK